MINIVQHGELYELRIDNMSFTHLYNQDRTKRMFVYDGKEEDRERSGYDRGDPYNQPRQ